MDPEEASMIKEEEIKSTALMCMDWTRAQSEDLDISFIADHLIEGHKKVSENDKEIPQSQTADKPWHCEEEPHNNHEKPGRQTKQSNQRSLPHQDDGKTRMDIK